MEVHGPVSYQFPASRHYAPMPPRDMAYHYHHHYASSHQPAPRPEPPQQVKLPGISDLLKFGRDEHPAPAPTHQRPDPSWPRSAPAPLKVETANIDPRLHKPTSPPLSVASSRRSPLAQPPRSPAYAVVAGPAPPAYTAYADERVDAKRLSLQSVASSRSSAGYPSPDTAQSAISMYPPVPQQVQTGASPRGMASQRPLPQDFPGPPPAPVSPRQPMHQHTSSTSSEPHYMAAPPPPNYPQTSPVAPAPVNAPSSASSTATTQDRYVCQSCNKAFSRPSSLRIHSHSHTGEKPFRCPRKGCGKAFSVRSNMKRHERGCHVNGEHGPRGMSPRSLSGEE